MTAVIITAVVLVAVGILVLATNVAMRKKGYSVPGDTAVRCAKGHVFRTVWIEGGSLKAVRLGPTTRWQYCPTGRHWAIIHPVREADLTEAERLELFSQQDASTSH